MIHTIAVLLVFACLFLQPVSSQEGGSATDQVARYFNEFTGSLLGPNVLIFDPSMDMDRIQLLLDTIFTWQASRGSEFNDNRFALLFKPGEYSLDIRVGYYMQVAGLGRSPEDVVIHGVVRSNARGGRGHVLTNFWRSAENLTVIPAENSTNVWGVSQAAPMRRVHIKGNLQLHDNGYASGGFLADSRVDGTVDFGPQQQWYSRNSAWKDCRGGAWNIMSMGVENAPATNWPSGPYITLPDVPVSREKPYLVSGGDDLILEIPASRANSSDLSWPVNETGNTEMSMGDFYIVKQGTDNAETG